MVVYSKAVPKLKTKKFQTGWIQCWLIRLDEISQKERKETKSTDWLHI